MIVTAATLPSHSQYSTGWVTTRYPIGMQVEALDYHKRTGSYVVGISQKAEYKLSEDDAWAAEGTSRNASKRSFRLIEWNSHESLTSLRSRSH